MRVNAAFNCLRYRARWSNYRRCYHSESSFPDPNRSDLFYHLFSPPTPFSLAVPAYALSFLQSPPPFPDSCTIIGWLPAVSERQGQEAGLSDFKENGALNPHTCSI